MQPGCRAAVTAAATAAVTAAVCVRLDGLSRPGQSRLPARSQMVAQLRQRAAGKGRLHAVPLTKDHRPGEASEKGVLVVAPPPLLSAACVRRVCTAAPTFRPQALGKWKVLLLQGLASNSKCHSRVWSGRVTQLPRLNWAAKSSA